MDVWVLGASVHPPQSAVLEKRLEEMVYDTTYAALKNAGVTRDEIDHVTIAASDELDGRPISSMLLAMPAGAYLKDETKCTDSGLTGLCLGAMRVGSGVFDLGLVVSWSKTSEAPVENVMRMRSDPFYTRPIGLNLTTTEGLFANAVSNAYGFTQADVNDSLRHAYSRALRNPRGLKRTPPSPLEIENSAYTAYPLREIDRAPMTDGAVAMVIASGKWLSERGGGRKPKAKIAGLGWRNSSYNLGEDRLTGLNGFKGSISDALKSASLSSVSDIDVIELDSQSIYHELAYRQALGQDARECVISPSGGTFSQNPYFCNGLINAVEAVLQVSDGAGPTQMLSCKRALAHGSHGFAQQGNVAALFERV